MKNALFRSLLMLMAVMMFGCASSSRVVSTEQPDVVVTKESIEVECKSPRREGCRYQGQVLPWNEWAEALGYSKEKYAVIDSRRAGSVVIVTLESR